MKTLRILALNWRDIRSPEAGGAEIHLHEILKRLVARGHQVTLIASRFVSTKSTDEETIDGIRTLRVGSWWNAHWAVPKKARALLSREHFDIVLDNVNKIPFFAPLWSRVPVVAIFHHLFGTSIFLETNPVLATAVHLYERQIGRVYRGTPAVVVSPSTAAELRDLGLRSADLRIIPPGLDHDIHRPGLAEKSARPLVAVCSRLKRYKRVDVAIRAFAEIKKEVPTAEMLVIGEGDRRAELESLARSLDLPVTFTGFISQSEKARHLNRAHVVLNPSAKEGWGMVAVESMACGTPVVASDVQGHRDSVPDGRGLRVPAGDPKSMAAAALQILQSPVLADRLRTAGLAHARAFHWQSAALRIEALLQNTCAAHAAAHQPYSLISARVEV